MDSLYSPQPDADVESISALAVWTPPVPPQATCAEVYERLRGEPDLISIAVVNDSKPVGLVNRHDLTMSLARDYGRALYANKPIETMMDSAPLIVDRNLHIEALESLIASEQPSALLRGFIITDQGRYAGIANALSLLHLNLKRTAQRNRRLELARQTAERANRSKSQFLANMSHELRTPLNAIIGFSDVIRTQSLGSIHPPKYLEYVNDIHESGHLLLSIIDDILDMAKIEAGRMALYEETVALDAEIGTALRVVADQAARKKLQMEACVAAGLPPLKADAKALRHILLNLLTNSIKFTPKHGRVIVSAGLRGQGIELSVVDTGIGMSPEDIAIALTPFGQVANEYTRTHQGTGLGLPLVKSLAELHSAVLRIDSKPGEGTGVFVLFPPSRVIMAG